MKNEISSSMKPSLFWIFAIIIVIWPTIMLSRDITKPFCELHSWGRAHDSWIARSHVVYGLSYTKGFDTFAVGNPPANPPIRYLDHPVLFALTNSLAMLIFGVNEWALRIANIVATITALLLFMKLVRALTDDFTALLSGFIFAIFPLTCFFGVNMWLYPTAFWAFWCYLSIIGVLKNSQPRKYYWWMLPIALFLMIQFTWEGFFFAMAIGVHYVCRCIHTKKRPNIPLLTILAVSPLASLALNFIIIAAGSNWNFQRIYELFIWRAGRGEMPEFRWSPWFERLWAHALTNFSLPILIAAILYFTIGQLIIFTASSPEKTKSWTPRRFPQFWLFFMPAFFQLVILKGTLWPHQYWERPMSLFIAVAVAIAILILYDLFKNIRKEIAYIAVTAAIIVLFTFCLQGTNYYHYVRWQAPEKINMLKMLNKQIPPDKALLSFEDLMIDQNKAKQASYRPEVAWYLDRDVVQACVTDNQGRIMLGKTLQEIQQKAATGKYPYYLIFYAQETAPVIEALVKLYPYEVVKGNPGEAPKNGKFMRVGMYNYLIFDLTKPLAQTKPPQQPVGPLSK